MDMPIAELNRRIKKYGRKALSKPEREQVDEASPTLGLRSMLWSLTGKVGSAKQEE